MLFEYGLEVSNNVVLLIFCYKNVMNINSGHLEKNPNPFLTLHISWKNAQNRMQS